MTKDEKFLLKLFELAREEGEIDRYTVGRMIGMNDKGIDAIVNNLAKSNFIIKGDDTLISLTPNGLALISHLK